MKRRELLSSAAGLFYLQKGKSLLAGGTLGTGFAVAAAAAGDPGASAFTGTARTLYNHSTSIAAAGTPVVMMAAMAPGDIPAGRVIVPAYNGTPLAASLYQQGAFSTHPDGSLAEGPITILTPAAIRAGNGTAAGSLSGLVLTSGTAGTAPPPITLAQIVTRLASSDIHFDLTGCDLGSTVYTVSLHDILTNFSAWPWGSTSPLGGYRVIESGQFPLIECWRYLKNASTGASHAWVKLRVYARFFSASAGGFVHLGNPTLENDACYGPVASGADFATTRTRLITGTVTGYEGSTAILHHGGASDPRAFKPVFNVSANTISAAASILGGVALTFSGPGLPSGLSTNTPYWPLGYGGLIYLGTVRPAAQNIIGTWAANTAHGPGEYVFANDAIYVCTKAGTTAAARSGPSGGGQAITDGTNGLVWQCVSATMGTARAGAVLASPILHVSQHAHQRLGPPSSAPLWIGTVADVIAGHDLRHLFKLSNATAAYEPAVAAGTLQMYGAAPVFLPGSPPTFGWNTDATGDGINDTRIGPIDYFGIQAIFRPQDTVALNWMRAEALQFADYPFQFTDERDGLAICLNNGPAKNGTAYPGRAAPSPNFQTAGSAATAYVGSGALRDIDIYSYVSNYNYFADFTHLPRYWRGNWLMTGDAGWLKEAAMYSTITGLGYIPHATVGGATYYHDMLVTGQQIRQVAWSLYAMGDALSALPATDPMYQGLLDMLADEGNLAVAVFGAFTGTNAAKWGILPGAGGPQSIPSWQMFLVMGAVLQIARRGIVPAFQTFWTSYLRNFHKLFNEVYGGWTYATNAYSLQVASSASSASGLTLGYGNYAIGDLSNIIGDIPTIYRGVSTDGGVNSVAGKSGALPAEPAPSAGFNNPNQAGSTGYVANSGNWNSYSAMALLVAAQMVAFGDSDGPAWFLAIRNRLGPPGKNLSWTSPNYGTPINAFLSFAAAV